MRLNPRNYELKRDYDPEYYQANRERILAAQKQWNYANREKLAEYRRAYRQKNPDYLKYQDTKSPLAKLKRTASLVARLGVIAGLICKSSKCESCGCAELPTEGHHPSYLKRDWLSVVWLCRPCHSQWHQKFKPKLPRKMYAEFLPGKPKRRS